MPIIDVRQFSILLKVTVTILLYPSAVEKGKRWYHPLVFSNDGRFDVYMKSQSNVKMRFKLNNQYCLKIDIKRTSFH